VTNRKPFVRLAEKSDIPGLVCLFSRYYSQNKPAAYFEWQFFSIEMPASLVVTVDGNNVVGSFGLMCRPLSNGMRCAQAMDMLLDETYRGTGLFKEMARVARQSIPAVDGLVVLANRAGMEAVTRVLGWKMISKVPVFKISGIPDCGGPDYGTRVQSDRKDSSIHILYSRETELWRFNQHPLNTYHRLQTPETHGYVKIFSASDVGLVGDILYVMSATAHEIEKWLCLAFKWFRENRVQICGLWSLPGTVMAQSAEKVGLLPNQQDRWLCVDVLKDSKRLEHGQWNVCEADAEFY